MPETTKALREDILARTAGKDEYGGGCNVRDARALCRDVDACVEALGELLRACSPPEPYDVFAFWDRLQAMGTPTARAMLKARAVLAESATPEPPRWHEGMRGAPPAAWTSGFLACWRYVGKETVCVLERGHDGGIHEPAATGSS